jgi:hypothetical protein
MHIIERIVVMLIAVFPASICPLMYFAYRRKLRYKRDDMANLMTRGKTLALYRQTYGKCPRPAGQPSAAVPPVPCVPAVPPATPTDAEIKAVVTPLFDSQYSTRNYIYPLAIVAVVMFVVACMGLLRAGLEIPAIPDDLVDLVGQLPVSSLSAIAGALVWGLYDLVARYKNIDLTPDSILYLWLRILLAPFLGYFVSIPSKEAAAIPLAFVIMTIPISSIMDFLQSQAKKKLSLPEDQPMEKPNLDNLQGMNATAMGMLNDEGIISVAQLAMVDPFKLLLKTNLEWATIMDLIDQAILYNYVGGKLSSLRSMGIRGAIELASLQQELTSTDADRRAIGKAGAEDVATRLGQKVVSTNLLIETLYDDLRVDLIWELWGDTIYQHDDSKGDAPIGGQETTKVELTLAEMTIDLGSP